MSEVGSGQVAIFPTFNGFRSKVTSETAGAGREGGRTFSSAFNTGAGDPGAALVKKLNAQIASGSKALSTARLAEQDAAGKVRVAEAALNEARAKGGPETARSIAAEERLSTAKRKLTDAQLKTKMSSDQLRDSQSKLADATSAAGASGEQASSRFSRGWAGLKAKLSSTVKGAVDDAGDAAKTSADNAGKSSGGAFGNSFKGALGALAGVFAVDKIVGGLKSAITEASGLGESVNALNVVFGDASGGIQQLGKESAQSLGLSNLEFNNLAVRFSSFAQTIAGPGGDVTRTLKDITGRASDFASVMNLEVADATALFQSGLAGESEPLRAYGIDLSAAAVEAYALEKGISASASSMTEAEKVQARYGLLMEKTSKTAGDFANTSSSLANQKRILSSSFKNTQATLGNLLLPALTAVYGFLNTTAIPVADRVLASLGGLGSGFTRVKDGARGLFDLFAKGDFTGAFSRAFNVEEDSPVVGFLFDVRETILAVFDALRPLGATFGSVFAGLGPQLAGVLPLLSPFGLVFQALLPVLPQIAALVASLVAQLGPMLGGVLGQVTPLVGILVSLLSGIFVAIMPTVVQLVSMLVGALGQIIPVVMGVISAVLPLVATLISQLAPIIIQLVSSILPPLVSIFGNILSAIGPVISMVAGLLIPIIQALMPVVVTVFSVIAQVITAAMQIVQGIIQVVTGLITGNWEQVWAGIGNIFSGIWNLIIAVVTGAIAIVRAQVMAGLGFVSGFIGGTLSNIGRFFSDTWSNVIGGASGFIGNFLGFFTSLPGKIMSALSGAGTLLLSVGQDMVQGLINGAKGMVDRAVQAIKDVGGAMLDGVKGFLGIKSPSIRFRREVGQQAGEGTRLGILDKVKAVAAAARQLVTIPEVPARGLSAGGSTTSGDIAAAGVHAEFTINQVDDPIGTSHAVLRRLQALGT